MIVAVAAASTIHTSNWYWRLPSTSSTRNLVEPGNTSPQMRLITIRPNPAARIPRRERIISRMSGQTSRRRWEEVFLGGVAPAWVVGVKRFDGGGLCMDATSYASACFMYSKHLRTSAAESMPCFPYSYSILAGIGYLFAFKTCSTSLIFVSPWPNGIFAPWFVLRSLI